MAWRLEGLGERAVPPCGGPRVAVLRSGRLGPPVLCPCPRGGLNDRAGEIYEALVVRTGLAPPLTGDPLSRVCWFTTFMLLGPVLHNTGRVCSCLSVEVVWGGS